MLYLFLIGATIGLPLGAAHGIYRGIQKNNAKILKAQADKLAADNRAENERVQAEINRLLLAELKAKERVAS